MPLSEEEQEAAYSSLAEAARACRLGWVLEQVEERIAVGKTTIKKILAKEAQSDFVDAAEAVVETRRRAGAPAKFVASEAYTSEERLTLLVDALLLAVPTAHQVAEYTLTEIRKFGPVNSIMFASDLLSGEPREVSPEVLAKHKRAVMRVEELLKELKLELQNAS